MLTTKEQKLRIQQQQPFPTVALQLLLVPSQELGVLDLPFGSLYLIKKMLTQSVSLAPSTFDHVGQLTTFLRGCRIFTSELGTRELQHTPGLFYYYFRAVISL